MQDKWDPAHNTSGRDVELREGSMLIVSLPPGARLGRIEATLTESFKGRIVNLLRNGGFEVGTPGYPPIGWWMRHFSTGDMSYTFWSDEDPAEGAHCLELFREKSPIRCYSQGIEIAQPGRYVLRCRARATCKGGSVNTWGTAGSMGFNIEPGAEWKEYRVESDLLPGTACIHCMFEKADAPNQTLWVDGVEFGRVAE